MESSQRPAKESSAHRDGMGRSQVVGLRSPRQSACLRGPGGSMGRSCRWIASRSWLNRLQCITINEVPNVGDLSRHRTARTMSPDTGRGADSDRTRAAPCDRAIRQALACERSSAAFAAKGSLSIRATKTLPPGSACQLGRATAADALVSRRSRQLRYQVAT
jgi:hypothetical protein